MTRLRGRGRAETAYRRPVFTSILARVHEPRRFVQVLAGPRQVGKTTLARQVMESVGIPAHFASADDPALREQGWLDAQWEIGRDRARNGGRAGGLLVLDEIQKVSGWSELVKARWDEDSHAGLELRVLLLGSAPLLLTRGLSESLAGRFELIRVGHWSFAEMRDAFGWSLDEYLFFGGYPGSADLIADEDRWRRYILDALVETSLARDILLLARVDKPALLRRLFRLACEASGDVVSFTRMLSLLPGAGNTVTLAHYLDLLAGAGMVSGVPKYPGDAARGRGSSPRLLALNSALPAAVSGLTLAEARADPAAWTRVVRTAVGAHLASQDAATLTYWRAGNYEVDYVLVPQRGPLARRRPVAIEIAGLRDERRSGATRFARAHPRTRSLIVGPGGIELEPFLVRDPAEWLA